MKKVLILGLSLVLLCGLETVAQERVMTVAKTDFNTKRSEFPLHAIDGNTLYIAKNKPYFKSNSQFLDVYSMQVNKELIAEGTDIEMLGEEINERYNDGPMYINDKFGVSYLTRNVYSKKELKQGQIKSNNLGLYLFTKVGEKFVYLKDFPHNAEGHSVGHAAYSELTNRLYFSSTKSGGEGEADLYYCEVLGKGKYGRPVTLGSRVNFGGDELFPEVRNGILYYTSFGEPGPDSKNSDIYYVSELGIIGGEKPKKLENELMNSEANEIAITFVNETSGYFASNRDNVSLLDYDIYYFELAEKIEAENQYVLNTKWSELGKKRLTKEGLKIRDVKTGELVDYRLVGDSIVFKKTPNVGDEFVLEFDETYDVEDLKININKVDDLAVTGITLMESKTKVVVNLEEIKEETDQTSKALKGIDWGNEKEVALQLYRVYFDLNKSVVRTESYTILDELVAYMKDNKSLKLKLGAHADSRASDRYNLALSNRRAKAVYRYLVKKGIPASQIVEYKGYGESQLINNCTDGVECSEAEHEKNRRVEFVLMK